MNQIFGFRNLKKKLNPRRKHWIFESNFWLTKVKKLNLTINLSMYLGENPNLSIHPFCWGGNLNSSTLLKVVIQYPSSLEKMTLHVSTYIFGRGWFLWKGWPFIYTSIWEGTEILSIYIWKGMAIHLPIY